LIKKTICYLLILISLIGCTNQNQENQLISLCEKIEIDIENYQTNIINYDEFYLRVEEYNEQCQNKVNDICIYIKSIMISPPNRKDFQNSYINKISESCKLERKR